MCLIGCTVFVLSANFCFLIGKEKDEIGILIHSIPTMQQVHYAICTNHLFSCTANHLILWTQFDWQLVVSVCEHNSHLTANTVHWASVIGSRSGECFYLTDFLHTGNSESQWNQSNMISYVTEKVCCHMDMFTLNNN